MENRALEVGHQAYDPGRQDEEARDSTTNEERCGHSGIGGSAKQLPTCDSWLSLQCSGLTGAVHVPGFLRQTASTSLGGD